MKETDILDMPFTNATSRVAMEVSTEGIKADLTVTGVKFYGNCTGTLYTVSREPVGKWASGRVC